MMAPLSRNQGAEALVRSRAFRRLATALLGSAVAICLVAAPSGAKAPGLPKQLDPEHRHRAIRQITEQGGDLVDALKLALQARAITAEQAESKAIRRMFEREGLVIGQVIHPPPGEDRADYGNLKCDQDGRRSLWLFFHRLAHVWQEQHEGRTGYELRKAVEEHRRLGDRVYDYERPPSQPLLSYRYEQQAAILADYGVLKRCGDPEAWLPDYERIIGPAMN